MLDCSESIQIPITIAITSTIILTGTITITMSCQLAGGAIAGLLEAATADVL